jgi:hypothetical protein
MEDYHTIVYGDPLDDEDMPDPLTDTLDNDPTDAPQQQQQANTMDPADAAEA